MYEKVVEETRQKLKSSSLTCKRLLLLQLILLIWGALSLTVMNEYIRGELATISFIGFLAIGGKLFIRFAVYRPIAPLDRITLTVYEAFVLLFVNLIQTFGNITALVLLWVPLGIFVHAVLMLLWIILLFNALSAYISYTILKREEEKHVPSLRI